jgi:hypothetical protein
VGASVTARPAQGRGILAALGRWWWAPIPRGRAAMLRSLLYVFVAFDVIVLSAYGNARHGRLPEELYRPLLVGRLLPLPTPTPGVVTTVKILLLASLVLALFTRLRRVAGLGVFALYFEWLIVYFSYGKVGHDRFAILVALAVLPLAPSARWDDEAPDEVSGWAVRCVQVAVVLTYFGAAYAKLRFGGIEWVNGATLMRAVVRRGTWLTTPLLDRPDFLRAAQYGIVAFEATSPLMLVRGATGRVFVVSAVVFQAIVYATIRLTFLPHLVCLLAFFPLERVPFRVKALVRSGRGSTRGLPTETGQGTRDRGNDRGREHGRTSETVVTTAGGRPRR